MALLVDIEKTLGSFHLRMQFETGNQVLALLGASGCGKSMTLKCIAGIETPDRGRIVLDGTTLFDSERRIHLPPQKRRVGYLFQQYALFPNMTVWQNIACGVRDKKQQRQRTAEMIAAMRLTGLEQKKPDQLSGGQQQRAALARILVNRPEVLLLDEPFSALDSHLRFQLESEVRSVIRSFGKTVLLVSHNRDEVFRLSDHIAVMHDGHIESMGDRKYVFDHPMTVNGAILTGCKNVVPLRKLGERAAYIPPWDAALAVSADIGDAAYIGLRMGDIRLAGEGDANTVECEVLEELENPRSVILVLRPRGADTAPLYWETDKETGRRGRGGRFRVCLPPEHILLLKE